MKSPRSVPYIEVKRLGRYSTNFQKEVISSLVEKTIENPDGLKTARNVFRRYKTGKWNEFVPVGLDVEEKGGEEKLVKNRLDKFRNLKIGLVLINRVMGSLFWAM